MDRRCWCASQPAELQTTLTALTITPARSTPAADLTRLLNPSVTSDDHTELIYSLARGELWNFQNLTTFSYKWLVTDTIYVIKV